MEGKTQICEGDFKDYSLDSRERNWCHSRILHKCSENFNTVPSLCWVSSFLVQLLLLLLSRFSCVRLCATPETAAHQAPPSLGFSRQEHWSGLPVASPMRESEVTQSRPTDSSWPYGLQPTRLLHPWGFPGKSTGVGCHCLLQEGLSLFKRISSLLSFLPPSFPL